MGIDVWKFPLAPVYERGRGRICRALVALTAVLATGCASVPAGAGFANVQKTVAERTGNRIQWYRNMEDDRAVEAAVQKMLGAKLNAEEAVQIALLNNRRLQATYEDLGLAQANLVQAGLLSNPVFDAAVLFPISGGSVELSFGIVQDFLSILYLPLRRQVAEAEFEAVKLRVTGAAIDLAAQVRAGFYQFQADVQRLEFLQRVVKATAASAEATKRLYEAGNVTELDVAREQAFYEESRLAVAAAETRLIQDHERLNALMGLWGEDTQWAIALRLPEIPEQPLDDADLERRAIEANLDLGVMRKEIETLAARFGLADAAALIPNLEAGAEAEREAGEWEAGPSFTFALPIFDQGHARLAAARAELRRAQQNYWAQAVEIRAAVRSARQSALSTRSRALRVRNVLLPLYTRVVNNTQLQYNAMQVGVFQLLEAKRQQIDAGLRYIDALRDYWLSRSALGQTLSGSLPDLDRTDARDLGG